MLKYILFAIAIRNGIGNKLFEYQWICYLQKYQHNMTEHYGDKHPSIIYITVVWIKLINQTNPNDGFVLKRFMSKTLGMCAL